MTYQLLLNFGGHELAKDLDTMIKAYARELNVGQKELLLMALMGFVGESNPKLARLIETYQRYDGRRKK
jgi:hypothetical protein